MKNVFSKLILLLTLLSMFSCKELTGDSTGANDVTLKPALTGETDTEESNQIGGINFRNTSGQKYLLEGTVDRGGNSGHNFKVQFKLPEGEKLTFSFFMTNEFSGGVNYEFTRVGTKAFVKISINGLSHQVELKEFDNVEMIDLSLDIHNDHTDIHLLTWHGNGPFEDYEECTFDDGCIYNSEDFAFETWLGVGRASGTFWGVEGNKNLILKLEGPLEGISNA